tara:strand:- start:231 stop:650 length:420 start_codon:yes stop_codon:yes gene_type:complete
MKKLFLTMTLALSTIFASAQFMVITTLEQPAEGADWEMSSLTDNMGIGYSINDGMIIGVVNDSSDYNLFARYMVANNCWVSAQAPTEEMMDNMMLGVGYSFKVWNELYVEPNFSMPLKEDENGEREGMFKLGVGYYFNK